MLNLQIKRKWSNTEDHRGRLIYSVYPSPTQDHKLGAPSDDLTQNTDWSVRQVR